MPEVYGFVAPEKLDLFCHHPNRAELDELRRNYGLREPDEIWICTTNGASAAKSKAAIEEWVRLLKKRLHVRFWLAKDTNEIDSQHECDRLRELIFRLVLKASECVGSSGQLLLSLAGGRKTMSADLQSAGEVFGASAWMHVVGPSVLPAEISTSATPSIFTSPLRSDLARAVQPLVVGRGPRSDLLDVEINGKTVTASRFFLPTAEPDLIWAPDPEEELLFCDLDRRRTIGSRLLGNFVATLSEQSHLGSWSSLLRMPPASIQTLRTSTIDADSREWLRSLPKADLHRHVGGCLDLVDQRAVGHAIWDEMHGSARSEALAAVKQLLIDKSVWDWGWPSLLAGPNRSERAAALLVHADDDQLKRNLYGREPRLALRASAHGFPAYERPGELTGSAVLTNPAAVETYACALVNQAKAEGLTYLELRGSPHKYRPGDPTGFLKDFRDELKKAGAWSLEGPSIGFVWILDRRQPALMPAVISQAVEAQELLGDFVFGLDLAGDEGTSFPDMLAPHFVPAFKACLKVTIHAGEGEPVESIWNAAYHLHADRIGHGLSILENERLVNRFRDRGTSIELCPSSNREVVGFADPMWPDSKKFRPYPMASLLSAGLSVVVCTDNPGISRTTLAEEFVAASRMTEGGISKWTALALIRESFCKSFAPARLREKLLAEAEHLVLDRCLEETTGIYP